MHPAYLATVSNEYTQNMTFYQRLVNWVHYVSIYTVHHLWTTQNLPEMNEMYIGGNKDVTIVDKVNRRTRLIFLNCHFSFVNRPLAPNAVEIGGIHIKPVKPLPPVSSIYLSNYYYLWPHAHLFRANI